MPSLQTADGAPVEAPPVNPEAVNREFSRAMAPDAPGGAGAPPRHDDPPPAGQQRGRGRPRKAPADEQPRVTSNPPETPEAVAAAAAKDYTDACAGLTTLGWATLAAVPPAQPWACIVEANQDDLVKALNGGCQHNPKIRAAVEKWSSGSGGVYALQLAAVGVNMGVQSLQLLKDPALRAEAKVHTQEKFREFLRANGVKVADPTSAAEQSGADGRPSEADDAPAPA